MLRPSPPTTEPLLQGADAVVLALRFSVLKDVIDEIADALE